MNFNLNDLSLPELQQLATELPSVIAKKHDAARLAAKTKLAEVAAGMGLTLEEIFGQASADKAPKQKKTVAVKFRHPANPSLTWTGRGRKPGWLVTFIEAGGKLEDLAV